MKTCQIAHGGVASIVRSTLGVALFVAAFGCAKGDAKHDAVDAAATPPGSIQAESALASKPRARTPSCAALSAGFADPHAAFARYADAINAADWCDAINTFAPAARGAVALASFRGLVLLAGADNPKRLAYFERLQQLCEKHKLACGSEARAAQLAQSVLNGRSVENELTGLTAEISQSPEDMFVELMTVFSNVDASTMSRFDSSLLELELRDGRASAKAHQVSGAVSKLQFVSTKSGWLLSAD